jgi:putative ABC transport system substrate-binding protein
MLNRRRFIALVCWTAVAWPLVARAQQSPMPLVGFIRTTSPEDSVKLVEAFRGGLAQGGFVEGKNVAIEYRYAQGQIDRLPALCADLVGRRVAVLAATGGTPSARAAKAATTTIPIVFTTADDPVKAGLVASFHRPGGNLTGVSVFAARLGTKRLGLLHELVPAASTIALLVNPNNPDSEDEVNDVREAGRASKGIEIPVFNAATPDDIDAAFAKIVQHNAGAVLLASDTFFFSQRAKLAALAARYRVPTMDAVREYAVAGGLISYGASLPGLYRQAGLYAARILQGDKPADLPVLLPNTFELVINLKTAKASGFDVPATLLARADEVIE